MRTDRMREDLISVAEAGQVFVTPSAYADDARLHRSLALLRREDPIPFVEHPDYPPFWALTRHADVYEAESHPQEFANDPVSVLQTTPVLKLQAEVGLIRSLIHMDDPDHKAHRALISDWFLPRNLSLLQARLDELARQMVDRMAELGGSCDFVTEIAKPYPLQVILAILGLPESDYQRVFELTQEFFGTDDPELSKDRAPGSIVVVIADFFAHFNTVTAQRRSDPTGDLASAIANGAIDGVPLGDLELLSHFVTIATAGHDTTAAAISGGIQALVEHPGELQRLRVEPELLATAADEIVRWVTPAKHFMRTVTTPYRLGDHQFEPGDLVLMSYVSANRDEAVFADPFRFDVGRNPNPHLAFGFGIHYCLGARLAKMEISALLRALVPRLRSIELAGAPELLHTIFVGGLKHLPVQYQLT